MLAPRWAFDPLSGAGAARAGGRWNAAGQAALYLSSSHATAIAEYQQDLPRPGTLTAYDVSGTSILDLADSAVLLAVGIDELFLRQPWKHTRDVLKAGGWNGVRVPSVQAPGQNLVLWRWNAGTAPAVRHLDPLGELPRDQASWPELHV